MWTFKQHFTMSFNGRREHSGTMFEGRYHERNHPAEGPAMWRTSAYIDINAWEAENEECRAGRGASPFRSKADPRLDIPDKVGIGLGKGSERTAKRILELLVDGPMRQSALREAVGIRSRIHFSRYYMTPLIEKGLVARTDPDSPKSPRQEYKLT